MKKIIILLLSFLVINGGLAQENRDTSDFPTIENDPYVEFQEDHSELDPDNMKPNVEATETQKQVVMGENSSFFTNIIYGTLLFIIAIIGWNLYQRYFVSSEQIEE